MHNPFPERPALLFDLVFPSRSENFLLNLGIADAHGLTPTFAGLGAQNNAVPCPYDSSLHASRVYRIPMAEALEALVMLVKGEIESQAELSLRLSICSTSAMPRRIGGRQVGSECRNRTRCAANTSWVATVIPSESVEAYV